MAKKKPPVTNARARPFREYIEAERRDPNRKDLFHNWFEAQGRIIRCGALKERIWANGRRTRWLKFRLHFGPLYENPKTESQAVQQNYINCLVFGPKAEKLKSWYEHFVERTHQAPVAAFRGRLELEWREKEPGFPQKGMIADGFMLFKIVSWSTVPTLQTYEEAERVTSERIETLKAERRGTPPIIL